MSRIFISSDFHFSHRNLCVGTSLWPDKSGCRDFQTVEDHDATILNNINTLVMPEDTLWILGDFSVGSQSMGLSKEQAYIKYRNLIRCKDIKYIVGNHSLNKKKLRELGIFSEVHDYYELMYKKKMICLMHYQIHTWNSMHKGSYHLFAHSHSCPKIVRGRSCDIGLDGNNFKPYLLDDILDELSPNLKITEGHHT